MTILSTPWTHRPPLGTPLNLGHQQTRGLIGFWDFSQNSTTGNIWDKSGFHRTGTPTALATDMGPPRVGGYAALFNGASSQISTAQNTYAMGIRRHATFSCWALNLLVNTNRTLFGDWQTSLGMTTRISSTGQVVFFVYPNNHRITTGSLITVNVWHHVVSVMDGDNMHVYVDGVLAGSETLGEDIGDSATTLHIGQRGDANAFWYGPMADCRVYNRALSQAEILDLFVNPNAVYMPQPTIVRPAVAGGPGTFTGSAAITTGAATAAASGTFTTLHTGSATPTTGAATASASGTFTTLHSGTSSATTPAATASSSGTFATSHNATSAATTGAATASASGTFATSHSATSAITTAAATATASGVFSAPGTFNGNGTAATGAATASASGTFVTLHTATSSASISPVGAAAVGALVTLHTGTSAATTGAATAAAVGDYNSPPGTSSGVGTAVTGAATATASGTYVSASVATSTVTVPAVTAAGTGSFAALLLYSGDGTVVAPATTLVSSGAFTTLHTGSAAIVIGAVEAAGAETVYRLTPIHALAHAVRDVLRQHVPLRNEQCDNQPDGRPPPNSGQYYVSVFPTGFGHGGSPDQHLGTDRSLAISIGVTQRTGFVPDDRMFRSALFETKGAMTLIQMCDRVIRQNRYTIQKEATRLLGPPYQDGKFVEPLRLVTNVATVRRVNEPHFRAKPMARNQFTQAQCKDYGVYVEFKYSGARYLESFLP